MQSTLALTLLPVFPSEFVGVRVGGKRPHQWNRSKKRGKSPVREPPPAPRATEPAEPPAFLSEYMDDGQGAVAELDGFKPVRCVNKGCLIFVFFSAFNAKGFR